MARPYIEFIQAQQLDWAKGLPGRAYDDVEARILSQDGETGAMSAILRYPPGWSRPASHGLAATEELFVLDGALEISGVTYQPHHYANLPPLYARQGARSPQGATVLTFFDRLPEKALPAAAGGWDQARVIPHVDVVAMPWEWVGADDPNLKHLGAGIKRLRRDPATGETSFLFCSGPHSRPLSGYGRQETHTVVEESFLLAGEIAGTGGLRRPGAYFWRPPLLRHGPFGTLTGTMSFIRAVGGRLEDTWSADEVAFDFAPKHQPFVPAELAEAAAKEWAPPRW